MDDDILNETHPTIPKTSRFLCCFGFPEKPLSEEKSEKIIFQTGSGRKRKRGFSWLRFRMKNSGTKTVPVDTTVSTKVQSNTFHVLKSKSKWKSDKATSKHENPVTNQEMSHQSPTATISTSDKRSKEKNLETNIHENGEHFDHADTSKDHTCTKRLSFHRRTDSMRTGRSQPGSLDAKPKPSRAISITKSTSCPARSLLNTASANPPASSRVVVKKPCTEKCKTVRNLDPVVGMSIIMVTLVIMLLWGRVCAILCTSAWFYFVPHLRDVVNQGEISGNGLISCAPDFNSEEYKKKVVLEGLLERNHRCIL